MVLAGGGWHEEFGLPKDAVKGAQLTSGRYNLESCFLTFQNAVMKFDSESWKRNSPIFHLPTLTPWTAPVPLVERDRSLLVREGSLLVREGSLLVREGSLSFEIGACLTGSHDFYSRRDCILNYKGSFSS